MSCFSSVGALWAKAAVALGANPTAAPQRMATGNKSHAPGLPTARRRRTVGLFFAIGVARGGGKTADELEAMALDE
jgi:hypothetical protein